MIARCSKNRSAIGAAAAIAFTLPKTMELFTAKVIS
jgi:hypothetical protein